MVGEFEGRPFHARELVEGSTLEDLAEAGSLGLREGLGLLAEVAAVVAWVHGMGFAHRNLSPANVLVTLDGQVRLIGFGRAGLLAGSDRLTPGRTAVPVETDVRGLQWMLEWLCKALECPMPTALDRLCQPGSVAGPAMLAEALAELRAQSPGRST
jgi:serine/threonine protein kinase